MRLVIQRVQRASVTIGGHEKAAIGKGLLILIGIEEADTRDDADWLVGKVAGLRIFDDADGVMNLSIEAIGGDVIVVSQFTLMASYRKGNRPSYIRAAGHATAIPLYERVIEQCRSRGFHVETGRFGEDMQVESVNDGPVTIFLDTKEL